MYTCMHAWRDAGMDVYGNASQQASRQAGKQAGRLACMHVCVLVCMHACIHECRQAYQFQPVPAIHHSRSLSRRAPMHSRKLTCALPALPASPKMLRRAHGVNHAAAFSHAVSIADVPCPPLAAQASCNAASERRKPVMPAPVVCACVRACVCLCVCARMHACMHVGKCVGMMQLEAVTARTTTSTPPHGSACP